MTLLAVSAGCTTSIDKEAHAQESAAPPKVKVAAPLKSSINEFSEYTGRAESVDYVEIRSRAVGHLQQVAFKEGALVKKGDLLFLVDPRPAQAELARARAEVARASAERELGVLELGRTQRLLDSQAVAQRDLDVSRSTLAQQDARIGSAAAAVTSAGLDLEYCYVRSPVSGRIGKIQVTTGNLVGPTTESPLATVVSVDPLYIYVDVDEARALHLGRDISSGKKQANVGFADEDGYPHDGAIDFMDNRVDTSTGTQKVRVVVKNEDGKLTPGLFARVRLPEGGLHDAVLVNDAAIGTDQDKRYVYVVGNDGKVQSRRVTLGPLHDGLRIVRDGVTADDSVVVSGVQRVRPGALVTTETVPMKPADSK